MGKKIHIASIKEPELKVRKKGLRTTQVQKSGKEYDRKKLKQSDRVEIQSDESGRK